MRQSNTHPVLVYGGKLLFLLIAAFLFNCSSLYAQITTPEGILDKVYDQRGIQYNLSDLMIQKTGVGGGPPPVALINCNVNSIFNLYFETGCGMEDTNNATHNARRAVICKLFQDLSDFLTPPGAPLATSSATKVNIWVRKIGNVYDNPSDKLGIASSFFCLPSSPTYGGIADGEIWKTIHTGLDSYLNLTAPLTPLGGGTNQSGLFYHGMIAFNFDNYAWNTNLSVTTIPNTQFDLYSAMLHEMVHALGFYSLINADGDSKLGPNFKYFSRYDTFLKKGTTSLLTTSACTMYDNVFNTAGGLTTSILRPGGSCVTDVTSCTDAINFVDTSALSVPVYRPNCFEDASSLSHFEDMNYPTCNANPLPNDDNYFLMSNAGNSGTLRRYLKPEERSALCDIGYAVKGSYGVSGAWINGNATSFSYGVGACGGISVAGVNDGVSNTGNFTFSVNAGVNFSLSCSAILTNDVGATGGFVCLQDLTATGAFPTTLSATSGTMTSPAITFNSNLPGLHLLRYIPVTNGVNVVKGNITYIYIYVNANVPGCTTSPSSCNLVNNGDFENNNVNVTQQGDFNFNKVCDWTWRGFGASYFLNNPSTPQSSVPCNFYGFENDNVAGHNAYGGIRCYMFNDGSTTSGMLVTKLTTALAASTTYQIKFDVSASESFRYRYYQLQAFVSSLPPNNIIGGLIPNTQLNTGILVGSPIITNSNGWTTVTLNITTSATQSNLEYLYLGVLNQPQSILGTAPQAVPGCNNGLTFTPLTGALYYLDNVSLVATGGAVLDLPTSICSNQTLPNLTAYLAAVPLPANGFFTGNGVVLNNGIYSFNPTVAGIGSSTVTYHYNKSNGCPMTISDAITVSNTPIGTPTFSFVTTFCKNTTAPLLPPTSDNGYSGLWSPSTVSNTASGNYIFTPAFGQCANTITKTITVSALPVISTLTPLTQTVCLNATPISLQVTVNGSGLTYQWYTNTTNSNIGGTLISGATNAVYTPLVNSTGTKYYYVLVTSALGCVTTSSVLTVIVTTGSASAGTLSGLQTLCKLGKANPTTVFTATVPGGTWSVSNTTLASIVSTTASPPTATIRMAPGTATVTYTVTGSNGCTASVTRTITTSLPTTPQFLEFPIDFGTGIINPTVVCFGGSVPSLPTISANGITGTWNIPTISNTVSDYYIFTPDSGQCASGFGQDVVVLNAGDFVTYDDFISVPYAVSNTVSTSVFGNDTYTGQTFDNVPFGVNYTATVVGAMPTFSSGGVVLNANGTFTVQANTTPGTYGITYRITTSCGVSNTSRIVFTIGNYVAHPGKLSFEFCYSASGQYSSINSITSYHSLLDLATVAGVPATMYNSGIVVSPGVPGLIINSNGTFTLNAGSPQNFSFYYRICSGSFCSDPIIASVTIYTTIGAQNDFVIFNQNGSGTQSFNILANDLVNICLPNSNTATPANVILTLVPPFNSYFSISSTGMVYPNTAAPLGSYQLFYKICDAANPSLCSAGNVTITQSNLTSRIQASSSFDFENLSITPNPSHGVFELHFSRALTSDLDYFLYDLLGKQLLHGGVSAGTSTKVLDLAGFAKGIYLLRMNCNDEVATKTLIKD